MSSYHKNSLITICAASSSAARFGFLSSEGELPYDVAPMILTFEEVDGNPAFEERILKERSSFTRSDIQQSRGLTGGRTLYQLYRFSEPSSKSQPISQRAWTFQEALLSTRMLVYTSEQLYWCCGECYIGCGGLNSSERIIPVRPDCKQERCVCGTSLVRELHGLPPDIFSLRQRGAMSSSGQWDMVVESFSVRHLSVESDKLNACAAVASYFGGIWKRDGRMLCMPLVSGIAPSNPYLSADNFFGCPRTRSTPADHFTIVRRAGRGRASMVKSPSLTAKTSCYIDRQVYTSKP